MSRVETDRAVLVVKADAAADVTVVYRVEPGGQSYSVSSAAPRIRHEISLENLAPNAEVFYEVTLTDAVDPGLSTSVSEQSFRTARTPGEGFSYGVVSDSLIKSFWPSAPPEVWEMILAQLGQEELDLVLHGGDTVLVAREKFMFWETDESAASIEAKYDRFFAPTMSLTAAAPMYFTPGNHEEIGLTAGKAVFEQELTMPENVKPEGVADDGYREEYYSFDNGDTHFVFLCTECPTRETVDPGGAPSDLGQVTEEQLEWLEHDLAATTKRWRVVVMHRSLYPYDDVDNRDELHDIFRRHGVNAVFQGHTHHYARHVEDGIHYVVTGGGGQDAAVQGTGWKNPDDLRWCRLEPPVYGGDVKACAFEHVKVDETPASMTAAAIDLEGGLLDSFTLRRTDATITIDASGGGCSQVGSWDVASGTCTLTADITAGPATGIRIAGDGITLDGGGHWLTGDPSASGNQTGVLIEGNNNAVRNLGAAGFWVGILVRGNGNAISGATLSGNDYGLFTATSYNNLIEGNVILESNTTGAGVWAGNNELRGNTIQSNPVGVRLFTNSSANRIVGNNFIGDDTQAVDQGAGNIFNDASGGNFWSGWTAPDADGDGVVDSPYVVRAIPLTQDAAPRATPLELDFLAPVVKSIEPAGTVIMSRAAATISYADLAPSGAVGGASGIDAGSVSVTLDGVPRSCAATETSASCDMTRLAAGVHTIGVTIADKAGNAATATGVFKVVATDTVMIDSAGGDCALVGAWDAASKTCTLTGDVYVDPSINGIVIAAGSDGVTLDGGGYRLIQLSGLSYPAGVVVDGSNAAVRNLVIEEFTLGIKLSGSGSGSRVSDNIVRYNDYGIWLSGTSGQTIAGNLVTNNVKVGIGSINADGNRIVGNSVRDNKEGLRFFGGGEGSLVYANNFTNNKSGQVRVDATHPGNYFSQPLPMGGNYYCISDQSDMTRCLSSNQSWVSPDINGDGIVDSPFIIYNGANVVGQDDWPWSGMLMDTNAPEVTGVAPAGSVSDQPVVISVDYADSLPSTGIDLPSVVVTLDGQPLDCAVTEAGADCDISGLTLAEGNHTIGGSLGDYAGNTAAIAGSFDLAPPVTDLLVPGMTSLVSTDAYGVPADGSSMADDGYAPDISADNHYTVFASTAANLVAGDANGAADIFVKDNQTGAIELASTKAGGGQADGDSDQPAISGDGRHIAFRSRAADLVAGDANGTADVFVKDTLTGETTCLSCAGTGGDSGRPDISADGRYVVFSSAASGLVAGDVSGTDIFLFDAQNPAALTLVSADANGIKGDNDSDDPSISADGSVVAYRSLATNLTAVADAGGYWDVFVRESATGSVVCLTVAANGDSGWPAVSADGGHVAFPSLADNLVAGDTEGYRDIFVAPATGGALTRVSTDATGLIASAGDCGAPSLSVDGRYVVFSSLADNLVAADGNLARDVFRKDTVSDAIARYSTSTGGVAGDGDSDLPAISDDGVYIVFVSAAANLVAGDDNGLWDIFIASKV